MGFTFAKIFIPILMKINLNPFKSVSRCLPTPRRHRTILASLLSLFVYISAMAQTPSISVPTISPLPFSICAGANFSVSFSPSNFPAGEEFRVQLSTATGSFTGSGTAIIGSGTGSPITATMPINVNTTSTGYRIRVISTTPTVVNGVATTAGQISFLTRPSAPTTTAGSRCGTGTVNLSASGCSTTRWYSAATGGTLLGSSANFTTPSISSTTNYFATCVGANGCESIRTSTTATVNPLPTITGFSPSSGTIDVDVITVTGTNLSGLTGAAFNGTAATPSNITSTSFNAVVPIGATTGPISATTGCGTISSTGSFTVIKPTIAQPTASVASGTYPTGFFTSLSCSTPDVSIYYTTNGNNPVVGSPFTLLYDGDPLFIPQNTTLRAIGYRNGWTTSSVLSRNYTVTTPSLVAKPVISPATGTYSGAQLVTITCATPGATIWFTTNGQIPVPFVNTPIRYLGPFTIIQTSTIRAMATAEDLADSKVDASFITLSTPGVQLPACTFFPLPGTYGTSQTVTISNSNPSAQIRFTIDGTDPNILFPLSRPYAGPIAINSTRTLKAQAFLNGFGDSPRTIGIYTIGSFRQAVDNTGAGSSKDYYTEEVGVYGMSPEKSGLSADLSVEDKDTYNIYPNPSTGTIYIDYGVARENVEVVIYNQLGIEAGRFSTKEASFGALYTIENKQSGVYFVKIKDASGKIKERKLVIQ